MLVNEVQQDGSIDKDEGDLLKNAIGFSEQEAQDILIHRVDLAALPVDATKEEVADLFTQTKYSRLLIYREDIDHIIGTIHQKDFYVGCGVTDKPLEEILSPVMFVLENEPISLLLKKLQLAKTQVAVVVDEYGGTCGHRDHGGHSGGAGGRDLGRARRGGGLYPQGGQGHLSGGRGHGF
ncbi:MAG: CBS domain-containing protein [Dysosmobacter sp.]